MIISLIAAKARNGVIGHQGSIPWHLPEDLKRFKKLTLGFPLLMGRKTFESIGRPLPGRRNIVITRNKNFRPEGVEVASSLEEALSFCEGCEKVFIGGGSEIYRQALPLSHELYLTEVDLDPEGDVYFPDWQPQNWQENHREEHSGYTYLNYSRSSELNG